MNKVNRCSLLTSKESDQSVYQKNNPANFHGTRNYLPQGMAPSAPITAAPQNAVNNGIVGGIEIIFIAQEPPLFFAFDSSRVEQPLLVAVTAAC